MIMAKKSKVYYKPAKTREEVLAEREQAKIKAREDALARQKAYEERARAGKIQQISLGETYRIQENLRRRQRVQETRPVKNTTGWKLGKSPSDYS